MMSSPWDTMVCTCPLHPMASLLAHATSTGKQMKTFCTSNNLMFIARVSPGYLNTSICLWNSHNTRNRASGKYHESSAGCSQGQARDHLRHRTELLLSLST